MTLRNCLLNELLFHYNLNHQLVGCASDLPVMTHFSWLEGVRVSLLSHQVKAPGKSLISSPYFAPRAMGPSRIFPAASQVLQSVHSCFVQVLLTPSM